MNKYFTWLKKEGLGRLLSTTLIGNVLFLILILFGFFPVPVGSTRTEMFLIAEITLIVVNIIYAHVVAYPKWLRGE